MQHAMHSKLRYRMRLKVQGSPGTPGGQGCPGAQGAPVGCMDEVTDGIGTPDPNPRNLVNWCF